MSKSQFIDNISFIILLLIILLIGIYFVIDVIYKNPITYETFTENDNDTDNDTDNKTDNKNKKNDDTENDDTENDDTKNDDGLSKEDRKINKQIIENSKKNLNNEILKQFESIQKDLKKNMNQDTVSMTEDTYTEEDKNQKKIINIDKTPLLNQNKLAPQNMQMNSDTQNLNIDMQKKTDPIGKPFKVKRNTFFHRYLIKAISKYFGNKEIELDEKSYVLPVDHHVDPNCGPSNMPKYGYQTQDDEYLQKLNYNVYTNVKVKESKDDNNATFKKYKINLHFIYPTMCMETCFGVDNHEGQKTPYHKVNVCTVCKFNEETTSIKIIKLESEWDMDPKDVIPSKCTN